MRTTIWTKWGALAGIALALHGCGGNGQPPPQPQTPPTTVSAPDTATTPGAAAPANPAGTPSSSASEPVTAADSRKRLIDATAQQEEWVPQLTPTPPESIAETLKRADTAFSAGKIDQGDGNALGLYLSVLDTQPENAAAKAGVDKVVTALIERADQGIAVGNFAEATRILPVVQKLRPDSPEVAGLRSRMESDRKIAQTLAQAQRLIKEGKLTEPQGENAAALYRTVLQSAPDNADAQQGLQHIEAGLLAKATAAAEAGNYAESDRLLAAAGTVRPGSQEVQNASTRIVELRQGRASDVVKQVNAAIDADDLKKAEELLSQLEKVSAQAQNIDDLRQRIESARIYASLRPGQTITDALASGGSAPEVVVMPIGSFMMGSPDNESDRKNNEGPRHRVTFKRGFALSRTEVTVGQFRAFVTATGYKATSQSSGSSIYDEKAGSIVDKKGITWEYDHAGKRASDNLPVIHVSWNDAKAYVDWLTRATGKKYRLPSEAEFAYALRAGSETRYPWGDGNPTSVIGNLTGDKDRSATRRNWVNAFPNYDDGFWGPAPVRSFQPNRFGLYDIVGNVSEWVEDCWHDNYQRAPADGSAWVNPGCSNRVIRGASWASSPDQVRSAFRLTASATTVNPRLGFRIARDL